MRDRAVMAVIAEKERRVASAGIRAAASVLASVYQETHDYQLVKMLGAQHGLTLSMMRASGTDGRDLHLLRRAYQRPDSKIPQELK